MTDLGTAIITAMAGQGWTLTTGDAEVFCAITPFGRVVTIQRQFLTDPELEDVLRLILLGLVLAEGLMWPWPPDHDPRIHGEIPTVD